MTLADLKAFWTHLISLKWMNTPGFMAQAGHFAIGIIVVALPVATAAVYAIAHGSIFFTWWWYALGGTILDNAYFIHKETNTDPAVEDEGFMPEGLKDCLFNALGLAVAWGTLYVAWTV